MQASTAATQAGMFSARLCVDGMWKEFVLDEFFPCLSSWSGGVPARGSRSRGSSGRELVIPVDLASPGHTARPCGLQCWTRPTRVQWVPIRMRWEAAGCRRAGDQKGKREGGERQLQRQQQV